MAQELIFDVRDGRSQVKVDGRSRTPRRIGFSTVSQISFDVVESGITD